MGNTYKSINDAIVALLKNTPKQQIDIERESGISRTQYSRWTSGKVKSIREDSARKVAKAIGYDLQFEDNKVIALPHTGDSTTGDNMNIVKIMEKTIDSQTTTIDLQNQKIAQLEAEKTQPWPDDPAKYKLFVDVIPHCRSTIELKNIFNFTKPIERCITEMNGFEKIAKLLDMPYSKFRDDYFAEGQWHPNDHHPAEKLFSKQTTNRVSTYSKDARQLLRNLQYKFLGYDYLSFYVDYEYNRKIVKTNVAIRIEFGLKKVIAQAKTSILSELN